MKEVFVVITRNKAGDVKVQRAQDLTEAICMQASILRDLPMDEAAAQVSEEEIESVLQNLKESLIDMAQMGDREVTIVFLPPS